MKKIFISLVSLLVFTSCVLHVYRFTSVNYNNSRISISAGLVNSEDEKSPVEYIGVSDVRSNVNTPHKVKILSSTIKIIDSNNKEYIAKTNSNSGYIHIYKQGVVITDDFKAYIGKVQLDDGTIIDIPPLSFKKTVYVERYSVISDTINAGGRGKEIFSGTVEDYKKQKK
ncbi:hypothetical protein [Fusobacterium periodonticum]|uniref:Uncharacterized protein n=2 Tax=Fusobacterium periodonticum TaxID=860 RepID=A0AAD0HUS5_9FUSO|nr:hypothetical protein [Fusobacterium periodonticum]AVQ25363.1 hypothetical protein C4N17_06425 [Fusobacterium periodonticum]KGE63742.1 hypothetical protein FSAG_000116 [Fusobacterium periodonticum 2_1_31]